MFPRRVLLSLYHPLFRLQEAKMEEMIPLHILPKLGNLDDVEAYLGSFEVLAVKEAWDRKQWVQHLVRS